jgi:hypothetical protein
MKPSKQKAEEYAAGIEKALRRAAKRAVNTAVMTGTRLVIYEKGQIKRVRPGSRLEAFSGIFKEGPSLTKALLAERKKERLSR